MKKLIFSLFICLLINASSAQKILFVNDNDDIVANSDTIINSLGRSKYKTFDHYNIADSAGIIPSAALMIKYDVVIWYSSTDGVGLRFWKDSSAINPNIKAFRRRREITLDNWSRCIVRRLWQGPIGI